VQNPEIFRPRSNIFYGVGIFALCVGMTGAYFYGTEFETRIAALTISSFICSIAYLLFIRPKVTFYDEGIVITNPVHEYTVGWSDIDSIEARYTMYVNIGKRKIHAWAAPAPGRYHARSVHPNELKGMGIPDLHNMRPGESPRTHSGVATHLARSRHESFAKNEFRSFEFSSKFDFNGVAILAFLFIASIAALVI
jgi:hypothetical protein